MFDWNDLRHFLAVARTGSTLGAARETGTSQPTVVRRIAALEQAVGACLFERRRTGYALTDIGREILPQAEMVEREADALGETLEAHRRRHAGRVRITCPESIANILVTPAVVTLRRTHPNVQVQLLIEDRYLDLTRGEADMAIRATTRPMESSDLIAKKLTDAPWAAYCSRTYAEQVGPPSGIGELDGHAIVGGEDELGAFAAMRWLEAGAQGASIAWRSNSLTNLHAAVSAGIGISVLPCLLGGSDPSLVKCFPAEAPNAEIWLLVRPDVRPLPHVRAFIAAIETSFRSHRALILGQC
ncbi:MAG TPA: LysR family transcriptional regulator [Allosphingosinicella sp.]